MESITAHSLKTQLADRILWSDGDSTVPCNQIEHILAKGASTKGLFVDQISKEIERFNSLVPLNERITVKQNINELDFSWKIPEKFLNLDVDKFIIDCLYQELEENQWVEGEEGTIRVRRTLMELKLYKRLELIPILCVLIYIINTLQANNIVWGVGRGSSVASYILYLIGVHDVDSVRYDLDISEFLRPKDN